MAECENCYRPANELYCYGIVGFLEVYDRWFGSKVCRECQQAWIDRHSVTCVDCGSIYVVPNVGAVKRCPTCALVYDVLVAPVTSERKRTTDKGLSSGLSREDWATTLRHFENKCVYCGNPYQILEHFTPVVKGGGTDIHNCVPACSICNRIKKTLDGRTQKDELSARLNIPIDRLIEIQNYLDTYLTVKRL